MTGAVIIPKRDRANTPIPSDLLRRQLTPRHCVLRAQRSDDRSIPIAVRFHKKLEVAEDKLYVITCGNPGFKNSR